MNQSSSSAAAGRTRVVVGWDGLRDGVKRRLRFLAVVVRGVDREGLLREGRGLMVEGEGRGEGGEVRRVGFVEERACDGFEICLVEGECCFRLWTLWP